MGATRVPLARATGKTRELLQNVVTGFRWLEGKTRVRMLFTNRARLLRAEFERSRQLNSSPAFRRIGLLASDSDTMLRTLLLFALVALTTSLKLPPPAIGRRAAVCLLPACLFAPQIAEAKYRASLAEMKGYGSSPYVDQMKGTEG